MNVNNHFYRLSPLITLFSNNKGNKVCQKLKNIPYLKWVTALILFSVFFCKCFQLGIIKELLGFCKIYTLANKTTNLKHHLSLCVQRRVYLKELNNNSTLQYKHVQIWYKYEHKHSPFQSSPFSILFSNNKSMKHDTNSQMLHASSVSLLLSSSVFSSINVSR